MSGGNAERDRCSSGRDQLFVMDLQVQLSCHRGTWSAFMPKDGGLVGRLGCDIHRVRDAVEISARQCSRRSAELCV